MLGNSSSGVICKVSWRIVNGSNHRAGNSTQHVVICWRETKGGYVNKNKCGVDRLLRKLPMSYTLLGLP